MRSSRRLKMTAWILGALLLALVLAVRYWAQPERVAALLAEQARTHLGLELAFRAPARYSLWPNLRLQLDEVRLSLPDEASPLLSLPRLDVSLPWSSLRDSRLVIEQLRLEKPQLDSDAAARWLARAGGSDAPALQLHLQIDDGSVLQGGKPWLQGLQVDAELSSAELRRWWNDLVEAAPQAGALPPLAAKARIERIELDGVTLQGVQIDSGAAP